MTALYLIMSLPPGGFMKASKISMQHKKKMYPLPFLKSKTTTAESRTGQTWSIKLALKTQ
jgi:hypothetical protein